LACSSLIMLAGKSWTGKEIVMATELRAAKAEEP
jgi:hypothetical protein